MCIIVYIVSLDNSLTCLLSIRTLVYCVFENHRLIFSTSLLNTNSIYDNVTIYIYIYNTNQGLYLWITFELVILLVFPVGKYNAIEFVCLNICIRHIWEFINLFESTSNTLKEFPYSDVMIRLFTYTPLGIRKSNRKS